MTTQPNKRIIAIDPATHSLAYACLSLSDGNIVLHGYGKINLKSEKDIWKKISIINHALPQVLKKYNVSELIIEQSIYISNFQTSRLISYIIGATGAVGGLPTFDVGPMTWKSGLGYKTVSAKEKKEWTAAGMLPKEVKKKAEFERKNRVKVILQHRIPEFDIDDDDVTDAVAIGVWRLDQ